MARWIQRVWLALGIWMGVCLSCGMAQGPVGQPMYPPSSAPVIYYPVPADGSVIGNPSMEMAEGYPVVEGERGPIRNWLYKVTHASCWTTHNRFGCSSLHSECTFIFGSCRAFFGQPCLKGPPISEATSSSCGCGFP